MKESSMPGVIALVGLVMVTGYMAYDRIRTADDRVENLEGAVEVLKEDLRLERQEGDPKLEALIEALRREVNRLRDFIRRLGFTPPAPGPGTEEDSEPDPEPTRDPKPTPTKTSPSPSPSPTCVPMTEVCL